MEQISNGQWTTESLHSVTVTTAAQYATDLKFVVVANFPFQRSHREPSPLSDHFNDAGRLRFFALFFPRTIPSTQNVRHPT